MNTPLTHKQRNNVLLTMAALVAESITRVPLIRNAIINQDIFWYLVVGSSLIVMVIGGYLMEAKRVTSLIKIDKS